MASSKMDINSLLSPQEGAARQGRPAAPTTAAPQKIHLPNMPGSPTSSNSSNSKRSTRSKKNEQQLPFQQQQQQTSFPSNLVRSQPTTPLSSLSSSNRVGSGDHLASKGPLLSPGPQRAANSSNTKATKRNGSTEKMDFLADLAAMRQNTHPVNLLENSQSSPSTQTPPSLSRRNSALKSPGDFTVGSEPTSVLPAKTFMSTTMSRDDLASITTLVAQLSKNPYVHELHVQLIKLLHRGLVGHTVPVDNSGIRDPADFDLLQDLRQARDAMDSRFTVGEELRLDWIRDECMLAKTIEDKVAATELCQKAVQMEQGSSSLWRLYGDWMYYLYKSANAITDVAYEDNTVENHEITGRVLAQQRWTEEDRLVGQEVFGWDSMLNVWMQGQKATQWHINDSHIVWDPYMEILMHDQSQKPTPEKVKHIAALFSHRLRQPHATWEKTFQMYSQFVSRYDSASYETAMVATTRQASHAKRQYELRQGYEAKLFKAIESGDKDSQWYALGEYLEWEASQHRRKNGPEIGLELYVGLSERANLLFPTDAGLWEDHLDLIIETQKSGYPLLIITQRATRHCPWSGNLWTKHLYALETSGTGFPQLEQAHIYATRSGLLEEVGGMDELIKVYTAWCGVLRRRAFKPGSNEDDRDVAEMGIRAAIENVKTIGEQKYGKDFKGDPHFRVEKIYHKFLAQTGRSEDCRKSWQKLTVTHGDMLDFWNSYYLWEMTTWGKELSKHIKEKNALPSPDHATSVLQRAMRRPSLDWPEKVIEMYLHHCAQHESAYKLQLAHVEARRVSKQVAKRRAREAEEAAALASAQTEPPLAAALPTAPYTVSNVKRKRESDRITAESGPIKKPRGEEEVQLQQQQKAEADASSSVHPQPKRDRENTTIVARNLPSHIEESRVRQFFRDCGEILSIHLLEEDDGSSTTATIEFDSREDVLTAQTKNMKFIDGHSIDIQVATGTTLWVTNYPPEADEEFIRNLFKKYGEIVEVRFPSLKYNTHRRFCYVQFLTPRQAQDATHLDGKALGGNLVLSAKISDPNAKKDRTGAMYDGRELYVGNVDWHTSEEEVRDLFKPYGDVQHVRIPRNLAGKSKGTAFVVFTTKEQAESATEMDSKLFKSRVLTVTISRPNPKGSKRHATTIVIAPSPNSEAVSHIHDSMDIDAASPASATNAQDQSSSSAQDRLSRTLFLRNIPDTVNDARIRTLLEQHGPLRKVSVRPDKQEATIEFENKADTGRAELAMQGFEISQGFFVEVGTSQLSGASTSRSGSQNSLQGNSGDWQHNGRPLAPIKRPPQAGVGRLGGRGGLGVKRSIPPSEKGKSSLALPYTNGDEATSKTGPKSNEHFRAIMHQKD